MVFQGEVIDLTGCVGCVQCYDMGFQGHAILRCIKLKTDILWCPLSNTYNPKEGRCPGKEKKKSS